jgi:predicted small integral membrane protein
MEESHMITMRHTATVTAAVAALLALTFTAADARSRTDQRFGMDDQRSSQRGEQWKHISGTIKKTKEVEVRGQDQDNLVVQLKTNRGDRMIVDLGNVEHIEDLDLQKGDHLTAWGRTVTIGGKRVFMAHKIRANDETVEIERQQMSGRDMRQRGRHADKYEFGTSHQDRPQQSARERQSGDNY